MTFEMMTMTTKMRITMAMTITVMIGMTMTMLVHDPVEAEHHGRQRSKPHQVSAICGYM